ncbi:MAG: hypothetical protein QG599_988 [Pseudomonadota bacterium]|nr:hypothetical protein [Pseudomonadota bacterium]
MRRWGPPRAGLQHRERLPDERLNLAEKLQLLRDALALTDAVIAPQSPSLVGGGRSGGAAAADAMGKTGQGFGIFIMVVGIIETVALLGLVFFMLTIR